MPSSEQPAMGQTPTLPEEVSDRTKAEFEKLTEHNRQLAEELNKLKQVSTPNVLDALRPSTAEVSQTFPGQETNPSAPYIDDQGYVDVAQLNKTIAATEERARKAEELAQMARNQIERFEETAQVRAVHQKYPQLDPQNPSYDPKFYNAVKNELMGQMFNGQKDLLAAVETVTQFYQPTSVQAPSREIALAQQEQAASIPSGSGQSTSNLDLTDEIEGSRRGDSLSIGKRLQNSGY